MNDFYFTCKHCGERIINYKYHWRVGNKVEIRWKHFRNENNCPKAERI